MKNNIYKIFFSIFFSFSTVILIKNIFIADSPMVKNDLKEYLLSKVERASDFIRFERQEVIEEETGRETVADDFVKIAPGVYSREISGVKEVKIKTGEMEWDTYEYIIDGKKVKIIVPKGEPPPKQ